MSRVPSRVASRTGQYPGFGVDLPPAERCAYSGAATKNASPRRSNSSPILSLPPIVTNFPRSMDQKYDILGAYVPIFLEHLADTRARLGLGVDPRACENQNSDTDSEVDDFSNWTHAERESFFRGLSVYSRWRPDLIAAYVPTRSEWEVWTYLEALEHGAAGLAAEQEHVEMHVSELISDDHDDTDGCVGEDEDEEQVVCKPALEVSQAWIDVEEQMAAWIVHEEKPVEDQGPPPKRSRGRSRGSMKPHVHDDDLQREKVMGHLEPLHLVVLDNILREGEEPMHDESKSREASEALAEHGDEEMVEAGGVEVSGLSNTPQGTRRPINNMVIDPVLLTLSGEADPTCQQPTQDPSESTLADCALAQAPLSLPEGPSQSTSSQPPPQVDSAGANRAASVELDMSRLSPRSRRRFQKRLYMRRKRAMLGEKAVDTGLERLKPGRKGKSEQSEQSKMSVKSNPVPCFEEYSDAEMESDENPKINKGGTTLPYKLKALFSRLGVDAAYLRTQGMDLLNLGTLGKLMGLYGENEEDESDTVQSIDAELIRHLQAGMVFFVTDVIHRAIVWREREIRLKQRCQAWRSGDQITIGAIEHAVDIIGARYRSHKEYFKSLEGLDGSPTEPFSPEPDDGTDSESVFSPHREVYTPLLRPPSAWKMGPLVSLTRTYEWEATRSQRGPSADVDEDDLMADETDEEALAAELSEEEEMDVADMKISVMEEEVLLNRVSYPIDHSLR